MEHMGHTTNTTLKTAYQHAFPQKQLEVNSMFNQHIDSIMGHKKRNP